jgi:hypothetical protein
VVRISKKKTHGQFLKNSWESQSPSENLSNTSEQGPFYAKRGLSIFCWYFWCPKGFPYMFPVLHFIDPLCQDSYMQNKKYLYSFFFIQTIKCHLSAHQPTKHFIKKNAKFKKKFIKKIFYNKTLHNIIKFLKN